MDVISVTRKERFRRIRDTFIMLMWVLARQFSHELQRFGLTLPQFVAVATLAACEEPCTMSDLTKVTLQDAPTMTGITDRLVKMKLVERTRSETDRRVVLVQITPAGIELLSQIRCEVLDVLMEDYLAMANNDEPPDLDRMLEFFEKTLEYILRVHLKRRHSLDADDLDAEIEKIRHFLKNPISDDTPELVEKTISPLG